MAPAGGARGAFSESGCDQLILFPCSADPRQVDLLADAALWVASVQGVGEHAAPMPVAKRLLRPPLPGVRVARSLYSRWRTLRPAERQRLEPLAQEAKRQALEVRGVVDQGQAERGLRRANEDLATALLESAESDPEVSAADVTRLRDELKRELDRLASAEIKASRRSSP